MGRLFGSAAIAAGLAVGFAGAPAGAAEGPGLPAPGVRARAGPGAGAARPGQHQASGRLPVEVRHAGRVSSLPGTSITTAGRGPACGYLTSS